MATGVIVKVFSDQDNPLYQELANQHPSHREFPVILGIVLTARHIINHENGTDNTLNLYFSLCHKLTPDNKDFLLRPINIGKKEGTGESKEEGKEE